MLESYFMTNESMVICLLRSLWAFKTGCKCETTCSCNEHTGCKVDGLLQRTINGRTLVHKSLASKKGTNRCTSMRPHANCSSTRCTVGLR